MIKEFEGGSIEYHLPNVIEGLRIVGPVKKAFLDNGVDSISTDALLAEVITHMNSVIDRVLLDGKEVELKELYTNKKAYDSIILIADELCGELFLGEEKKNT